MNGVLLVVTLLIKGYNWDVYWVVGFYNCYCSGYGKNKKKKDMKEGKRDSDL